ncbi:MAG: GrpE protein [Chloroflexi bacterium]|nr:GrpE protein [Chloroflexota bacterium]
MTEKAEDIIAENPQEDRAAQEAEPVVSFVREASATPTDETPALREELEKTKSQAAEYLDGWQRARAELANARKRFEKERSEVGQFATGSLLRKILPVLDDLDRAMKTVPDDLRQHPWVDGVALIQRKFQTVLESEGVKPIEVKPGDPFDPTQHEAMTHEENKERKEGEIIAEVQKGYRFRAEVLRPALVRVAK